MALAAFGLLSAPHSYGYESTVAVDAGYRRDSLRWSIAGDLSGALSPNVLSELTWEHVDIAELTLAWTLQATDGPQLRAKAAYGWIRDGRNRDSDYLGDDRTLEFSRSDNETNDDDVLDLALAVGYRLALPWERGRLRVTPLLGFSRHEQRLRITGGFQTIPPLGPFSGLDSTYRTRWSGPWIGVELAREPASMPSGFLRLEHHWADYDATANWNLRDDFRHPRSFEHEADGKGFVAAIGVAGPMYKGWSARLSLEYQRWETDPGIDRVYFADGAVAATRLNEVKWESRVIAFGLERDL